MKLVIRVKWYRSLEITIMVRYILEPLYGNEKTKVIYEWYCKKMGSGVAYQYIDWLLVLLSLILTIFRV